MHPAYLFKVWGRDGAFAAMILDAAGYHEEAGLFLTWMSTAQVCVCVCGCVCVAVWLCGCVLTAQCPLVASCDPLVVSTPAILCGLGRWWGLWNHSTTAPASSR